VGEVLEMGICGTNSSDCGAGSVGGNAVAGYERLKIRNKIMRYLIWLAVLAAAVAGGCGLIPALATPTSYEQKIPAEFNLAKGTEGKVAVLAQGGPDIALRREVEDVVLLELKEKVGVKKDRLVARSEIDKLRLDQEKYLAMTPAQLGAAAGAGSVLVVKIVKYELYPMPLGRYYDCSMSVSAMLVDVATGIILWPADGMPRSVSFASEGVRGDAKDVTTKLVRLMAHGVTRYLYDCPKAYFRMPGESRGNGMEDF
jgi:hypothetical protein